MRQSCLLFSMLLAISASTMADPAIRLIKLFESGKDGYHTYRIPALAVTEKGTLLAFCEGRKGSRSDSGDIDLLMRRSLDNGNTWETVQVIVDDDGNTCGNPCPIVDRRTGTIVLLLTKNLGAINQEQISNGTAPPRSPWITTSTDDGITWTAPVEISDQARKPDWRWYATGPCHGIRMADGRLVAPCDHTTSNDNKDMHSHILVSDDGGKTWQIEGIQDGWTDESTVVELADGGLYLNMRNYRGTNRRAWSISRDRGVHWSPVAEDETLVEPVCQASVIRLSTEKTHGKNRVLFSNPASVRRENLTVRLSYDECKSWPVAKTLWPGPSAYSDLVVTPDGRIGCLFECGEKEPYETIALAFFTLDWLTDGKDRL
ncbi:MAG TPA: sialidase family protein [bacterium]|nr:sialidase family protein [bacterium]